MDENTRFRRALKNPMVMIGLCVLAGIAVYYNIMGSAMEFPSSISVAQTLVPPATKLAILPSSSAEHDEVAIQWISHPARDPFAPVTATNKRAEPSLKHSTTSASSKPTRRPRSPHNLLLKAVAIEAEQRSAVINRQVVYEGEMIEGYQVVSIQLKGVWLERHGRKEFLTFATNTTS